MQAVQYVKITLSDGRSGVFVGEPLAREEDKDCTIISVEFTSSILDSVDVPALPVEPPKKEPKRRAKKARPEVVVKA